MKYSKLMEMRQVYTPINTKCHSRISIRAICTTLCDKVCQWLATGWSFSLGTQVSSTNKTDRHDITEILLKVALNTVTLTLTHNYTIQNKRVSIICTCTWSKSGPRFPLTTNSVSHSCFRSWWFTGGYGLMVFSITFSNFSVVLWIPNLLMKESLNVFTNWSVKH